MATANVLTVGFLLLTGLPFLSAWPQHMTFLTKCHATVTVRFS